MRNYITPDHCNLSDVETEARNVSRVANGNQRLSLVRGDRDGEPARPPTAIPGKVVLPSSDFEGFGTFSG